jgi:formylglycine-generating enzyme required for sulfatase activity
MGSDDFYPEERPVHRVTVDEFWMDPHPVTVAEFRSFVEATGYVTVAERAPDPAQYPGVDRSLLVAGSLVFRKPARRVSLRDVRQWWCYVPGACWHSPEGPGSTTAGREQHPVTHVAYEDATSYASWAGKQLPNEAEWERAARGGLEGAAFVWGDEFAPGGRMMANTWQGEFPWQNLATDGYEGTSPVGAFPPNGYGLYDMAGNVWEWTRDAFTPHHRHGQSTTGKAKACCAPQYPLVEGAAIGQTPAAPIARMPARVLKGGSHLCAPNYCLRYRPAARQPQDEDSSASHIGFRCIVRDHATPMDPTRARP